jgi:hypothetical protein
MMTKERLQEIRDTAIADMATGDETDSTDHVLELIAEVERLQAVIEQDAQWRRMTSDGFGPKDWAEINKHHVPHVGPPDTTPCVQVPITDARDGGL